MLKFIDTHAHLTDARLLDTKAVQQRWEENHISDVFTVSYDKKSMIESVELARNNPNIYAIIGIHPDDYKDYTNQTAKLIEELAKDDKVVAIGEIGLDYHMIDSNDIETKNKQKEVFVSQIKLADKLGLPIMIHLRSACKDLVDILFENRKYLNNAVIIHCYSESVETYNLLKKLNVTIGIGGVVTFKNGRNLQEVVKEANLSDIILETDCPYLSPEPYRGTTNEPKNILYIAEKICEIKNISLEELSEQTCNTVKKIFPKYKG